MDAKLLEEKCIPHRFHPALCCARALGQSLPILSGGKRALWCSDGVSRIRGGVVLQRVKPG